MHCLACNKTLSDKEASVKFEDAESIPNPEDRYVGLCTGCLKQSDLAYYAPDAEDEHFDADEESYLNYAGDENDSEDW